MLHGPANTRFFSRMTWLSTEHLWTHSVLNWWHISVDRTSFYSFSSMLYMFLMVTMETYESEISQPCSYPSDIQIWQRLLFLLPWRSVSLPPGMCMWSHSVVRTLPRAYKSFPDLKVIELQWLRGGWLRSRIVFSSLHQSCWKKN